MAWNALCSPGWPHSLLLELWVGTTKLSLHPSSPPLPSFSLPTFSLSARVVQKACSQLQDKSMVPSSTYLVDWSQDSQRPRKTDCPPHIHTPKSCELCDGCLPRAHPVDGGSFSFPLRAVSPSLPFSPRPSLLGPTSRLSLNEAHSGSASCPLI